MLVSQMTGLLSRVPFFSPPIAHIHARWVIRLVLFLFVYLFFIIILDFILKENCSTIFLNLIFSNSDIDNNLNSAQIMILLYSFTYFFAVDGDVHSPVWAEVRRFDGVGGRSSHQPSVGERRRSGWPLGEGWGRDCNWLIFSGKNFSQVSLIMMLVHVTYVTLVSLWSETTWYFYYKVDLLCKLKVWI